MKKRKFKNVELYKELVILFWLVGAIFLVGFREDFSLDELTGRFIGSEDYELFVDCVLSNQSFGNGESGYLARFGYRWSGSGSVALDSSSFRGPKTGSYPISEFEPGEHVFDVEVYANGNLRWSVSLLNRSEEVVASHLYEKVCGVDLDGDGYEDDVDCDDLNVLVNPDALEICDGVDNDCDGEVDEDLGQTICGVGVCEYTVDNCVDGQKQICNPMEGSSDEICDSLDNDCDGNIDEGVKNIYYADFDNDGYVNLSDFIESCEIEEGYIVSGLEEDCDDSNALVNPGASEVCNGLDDDCSVESLDGSDEEWFGFGTECGVGECTSSGMLGCVDGVQFDSCVAGEAGVEACDSVDNDCDGSVDEGVKILSYRDFDGDGYVDVSMSAEGCDIPDGYALDDLGEDCDDNNALVNPGASEVCNGLDDDCDGLIDEDLIRVCSTECGDGNEECVSGEWTSCDAPLPGEEVCDSLDNDCDGDIDEEFGFSSCGVGICEHSVDNCVDGVEQVCDAFEGASAEVCDGLDNDCDGSISDDGSDEEWYGQVTYCGLGECLSNGMLGCVDGVQVDSCVAGEAGVEACDSVDNDCDGSVDEDLGSVSCGLGICEHSVDNCVDGEFQECDPFEGALIEGCNNLDDDCDGLVDEEGVCCELLDVYWDISEAEEGQIVFMNVETTPGCIGGSVSFEIIEKDVLFDDETDFIVNDSVIESVVVQSWVVEWDDVLLDIFDGNELEYAFVASIEGIGGLESDILVVSKASGCLVDGDCDDLNNCTDDFCLSAECGYEFNNDDCDDGLFCSVNDVCSSGVCLGVSRDCDDDLSCSVDSCNEFNNSCEYDYFICLNDTVIPEIVLIEPVDGLNTTERDLLFRFSAYDDNASELECDVYLNDNVSESLDVLNGDEVNLSISLSDGLYTWYVGCLDENSNLGVSEEWNFSVYTAFENPPAGGSGGGGGGGGSGENSRNEETVPVYVEEPVVEESSVVIEEKEGGSSEIVRNITEKETSPITGFGVLSLINESGLWWLLVVVLVLMSLYLWRRYRGKFKKKSNRKVYK